MTDIVKRLRRQGAGPEYLRCPNIMIEAADEIERLRAERDEARAALEAVEPYLDAIVCYASTIGEHDGNRVAAMVRAALPPPPEGKP